MVQRFEEGDKQLKLHGAVEAYVILLFWPDDTAVLEFDLVVVALPEVMVVPVAMISQQPRMLFPEPIMLKIVTTLVSNLNLIF